MYIRRHAPMGKFPARNLWVTNGIYLIGLTYCPCLGRMMLLTGEPAVSFKRLYDFQPVRKGVLGLVKKLPPEPPVAISFR